MVTFSLKGITGISLIPKLNQCRLVEQTYYHKIFAHQWSMLSNTSPKLRISKQVSCDAKHALKHKNNAILKQKTTDKLFLDPYWLSHLRGKC